jgi:MFS family permease
VSRKPTSPTTRSPREVGLAYALSGLLRIIEQGGLIGHAARVFEESLQIALALASLGNSVSSPSLTHIVTQLVPDAERGVALGLMQNHASLASISATPISGWLIDHRYLASWGWFAAACRGMALLFRHWGFGEPPFGAGRSVNGSHAPKP